ncbi:MAG: hypothetical protein AVDCRST_MAG78-3346 [uncultured Rubrobacteraceae bacterium]|uniref:Uncharacterized protein n=1 Tax=uncultured Rubrobacteraceae bacterium TaxID=349277 RepID=A0A6J4QP53_9ACTN|nr:MAG: hypothetical protein AVDCRST_MAG78-3346 [uncultured Rubrobacteraceae bacterium]
MSRDPCYFVPVVEDIIERKQVEQLRRSLTLQQAEVLKLLVPCAPGARGPGRSEDRTATVVE